MTTSALDGTASQFATVPTSPSGTVVHRFLRDNAGACGRQRTIMLADDHPVVREGLRSLLDAAADVSIIAEADSVTEAVGQALLHRPDVLVLGLSMPPHEVGSLIGKMLRSAPGVGVLVFSEREDAEAVFAAIRAGARGYIGRATATADIVRAIRGVAAGWAVFSPPVASCLSSAGAGSGGPQRAFPELTTREYEILDMVAAGLSNVAVARRLHLESKTISNHLSRILMKLGVPDRANAIVRARNAGLGATGN